MTRRRLAPAPQTLIEPVDRVSYYDGTRQIPPQIFAHNMGQKAAQNLHPQEGASKGVLGRMLDALAGSEGSEGGDGLRGSAFAMAGRTSKALEAETTAPDIISAGSGVVKLALSSLASDIFDVLAPTSTSLLGDTIAQLTGAAISRSNLVGDALDAVTLSQTFGSGSLSVQLELVAKAINASHALDMDRAVFFVELGGFDTHSDVATVLESQMGEIDAALQSFVAEMKSQQRWDDVAVVSVSEFGRTVRPLR